MRHRYLKIALLCCISAYPVASLHAVDNRQPLVTNGNITTPGKYPFLTAIMSGRKASVQLDGLQANAYFFVGGLQLEFSGTVVDCGLALSQCTMVQGKICFIALDFPTQDTPALSPEQQLSHCSEAGGIGAIFRPNTESIGNPTLAGATTHIPAVYINDYNGNQMLLQAMLSNQETNVSVQSELPDTILCGGTYLGGSWVLTAAHCVIDDSGNQRHVVKPEELVASVSAYKLGSANEYVQQVTEVILFDYHTTGPWSKNDYALLRLDAVPRRGEPVALVSRDELDSIAAAAGPALVLGWGSTAVREPLEPISAASRTSSTPLSAVLMLHTVDSCRDLWRDFFRLNNLDSSGLDINNNHICASNVELQKDTCQGDSGGPLLVNSNGELKLAGVTSFGLGCGSSNSVPGVYASVPSFRHRLMQITGLSNLASPDRGLNGQTAEEFFPTSSSGRGSLSQPTLWVLLVLYSGSFIRQRRR